MFSIEGLIKEHSMFFQVFKIEHLNKYVAFLVSNDIESKQLVTLISYDTGIENNISHLHLLEWFPFTLGDTFQQAVDNLENKLSSIPINYLDSWDKNVSLAYKLLLKSE